MRPAKLFVVGAIVAIVGMVPGGTARGATGLETVEGVVTYAADGSPAVNAVVWSPDVPSVPAVHTDAQGAYSLNLPDGVHEVRASTGGCTDPGDAMVDLTLENATEDFSLAARPDPFGYTCTTEPLDLVPGTKPVRTRGLYGVGTIPFPFKFPFAGLQYKHAKVLTGGILDMLPQGWSSKHPVNDGIVSVYNVVMTAAYADSGVFVAKLGAKPNRTLVIEWRDLHVSNVLVPQHVHLELQLHENGDIDVLYANEMDNPQLVPRALELAANQLNAPEFLIANPPIDTPPLNGVAMHFAAPHA